MNKHMRAKVSDVINQLCMAEHSVSPSVSIRALSCSNTLTVRSLDGSPDVWLTPIEGNSTLYAPRNTCCDERNPAAIRYNWLGVFDAHDNTKHTGYRLYIYGLSVDADHSVTPNYIYVTRNPCVLRDFVACLLKLGATGLYSLQAKPSNLYVMHKHGCYLLSLDTPYCWKPIRNVRIGERGHDGRTLRSCNECLCYLVDSEDI